MNKRQIDSSIKQIAKRMADVAKARDRLDDAISEASDLREHCSEAWDDLQRARDTLSQLV